MTQSSNFTPKHPQPVTMDALLELEPAILAAEVARLENSINHLLQSNTELLSAEEIESDAEERKVFLDARQENEDVINRQKERITMMKIALFQLIGVGQEKFQDTNEPESTRREDETGGLIEEDGEAAHREYGLLL